VRSSRETSQPNLADLEYWATGLTPIYLEGALDRALAGPIVAAPAPVVETPFYEGPAPATVTPGGVPITPASVPVTFAVLDPFSVYAAEGETRLRERLEVLSAHQLRQIVRGYGLVTAEVDIATMTVPELVARIIAGVRTRLAA
jgi:hypothetical protein